MRIGISAIHFAKGKPSSAEPSLAPLIHAIADLDPHNTYYLFVRPDNRDCFPPNKGNVRHIVFPNNVCRNKWLRVLCEQFVIPCLAAFHKIDVLHSPGNVGPAILPCKSVITVHWLMDTPVISSMTWHRRLYHQIMVTLSTIRADRLIAVSSSCKSDIVRMLKVPADKIEVVYHGVGKEFNPSWTDEAKRAVRSKFGLRDKFILAVVSSESYENLRTLLDAYLRAKIRDRIPHQLVLAGNLSPGDVAILVETCCSGDLGFDWRNEVILTGYLPYDEMPSLYGSADLLVDVSTQATFGLPLIEAMASGIPFIMSNIPAFLEVAADAGMAVDPYDPGEVAQAIHRVVANPELAADLVWKGSLRVASFTWEKSARKTLEVYGAAMKSKEMKIQYGKSC